MPRTLFELTRPATRRRRQAGLSVAASIAAHALVIGGLAAFTLLATDTLPPVERRIDNIVLAPAAPAPPPPPPAPRAAASARPAAEASAAPVGEVPTGIAPEIVRHGAADGAGAVEGGVDGGIATGVPGGMLGTTLDAPSPPPPPPPARTTPVRVGGDIAPPVRVHYVAPLYPPIAQSARVEGIVVLDAIIDREGRVTSVVPTRSIALLDEAAIAAVRQWRYRPTRLNGVPVPVLLTVEVKFQLR
ncbi:MAG: TonB family protein [Vicinamibacteraceae bacterium]|nr:TonB family protein [Vicinamibacteraceae bacterium]